MAWLWKSKNERAVERVEADIAAARAALLRKINRLGNDPRLATIRHGNGVGHVAAILAERFSVSVSDALSAQRLGADDLHRACLDLAAAHPAAKRLSQSPSSVSRELGVEQVQGIETIVALYRLRLLSVIAPLGSQQETAGGLADEYADYIGALMQIVLKGQEQE